MMHRMRSLGRLFVLSALVTATMSCGDVVRQGRSPMLLVMDSLQGLSGGSTGTPSGTLLSDVVAYLTAPDPCTAAARNCPTILDDFGSAVLSVTPKDPSFAPTSSNQVIITRYHVSYRRADGRNTPGVDVPYGFDGAVQQRVDQGGSASVTFELVRHAAKEESPLVQLSVNPQVINTITDVTFYGTDLVGNAISVTGSISIEFGNFADK